MIVPADIREKLSKLVASTNIDDATKQKWLEELKKEEPSPSVLYEIAKTMDDIREREDEFSDEVKEINEFFDKQEKSLTDSGNEIESDITNLAQQTENLKQEVKELEQEYGATAEVHEEAITKKQVTSNKQIQNSNIQTDENDSSSAQAQHLRSQAPQTQPPVSSVDLNRDERPPQTEKDSEQPPQGKTSVTPPIKIDDYYK